VTGLEQRLAFGIDRRALLGADHEGPHPIAADAAFVRKRFRSSNCIRRMNWSVLPWCGVADSSSK
jgi:hypothetical protein